MCSFSVVSYRPSAQKQHDCMCFASFSSLHNHAFHACLIQIKAQHQVISGFFGTCCTFYFCAGVTCRLVPVRWVGVQLYPAARWQQMQRLSLEDSHTEQLRFSPLLTFLRDSRWGGFTLLLLLLFLLSAPFAAVLCFATLIFTRRGSKLTLLSPALQHICSQLPSVSEMVLFCNRAQQLHQQSWCHSFLTCNNHIKPDLSLLLLI